MFDRVAGRYDVTNTVLSGGLDAGWRRATREALGARPGQTVLDVAAGTGVSTVELASGGVTAIACDFSQGMLRAGVHRPVPMVAGDAMALPLADDSVDGVVISFGLRNVADPAPRCASSTGSPAPAAPWWSASSPPPPGRPGARSTSST